MYLPLSVLEKISKIPNRTMGLTTVLGYLLNFKKKDFTELNQIQFNKLYSRLAKLPTGVLSNFQVTAEQDYLAPAFERYNIDFPQVTFEDMPKDLDEFNKLYKDILYIREMNLTRYFDSLFPSEKDGVEEIGIEDIKIEEDSEKLTYALCKKEVFDNTEEVIIDEEFEVNSQRNSVLRSEKVPYLTSGSIKTYLVTFNAWNYILNKKGKIDDESLKSIMTLDIAEVNAIGNIVGRANRIVSDFVAKNFDDLSENFF